jgi:hypothetical protein
MVVRRIIVGGLLALGMLLVATTAASAASVTVTPNTISYDGQPVLKATGLTPNTTYVVQIYDHFGLPIIPGPFVTATAGADGTATIPDLAPDQTDQPGVFTFEVQTQDGKLVARTTATLTGTNTYYVQHRLLG